MFMVMGIRNISDYINFKIIISIFFSGMILEEQEIIGAETLGLENEQKPRPLQDLKHKK